MGNREILHLISILLQYPDPEWFEADLERGINDLSDLNPEIYEKLRSFFQFIRQTTIDKLQDLYVQTFDFNEKTNLYLTYSKMKEEKKRGVVLAELKQFYEQAGFIMETDELPDYFPLFLEFITVAKDEEIKKLLAAFLPAIETLKDELLAINSPYANLVEASLFILHQMLPNDTLKEV
ncbi:nitrate reductase molybdenum cofactor assembly chaperone [Tepidibacillus sp. LV47]|uniref:nitrate reductase molybdenum cofactor assembly chaperone n=1 Tax=Tepidibacillus sp. LV47 TaxID=3398228 RepID=UPI003AAE30EB